MTDSRKTSKASTRARAYATSTQWFDHPRFDNGTDSDSYFARRARRERDPRPLAARLSSRENARVAKATTARIGHDPNRTKAEYLAELWITARALYPSKVADR